MRNTDGDCGRPIANSRATQDEGSYCKGRRRQFTQALLVFDRIPEDAYPFDLDLAHVPGFHP